MSRLLLAVLVMLSAVLGAGAGTAWHFASGGGVPASGGTSSEHARLPEAGPFLPEDAGQFILDEVVAAQSAAQPVFSYEPMVDAPWCTSGQTCAPGAIPACRALGIEFDTVVEPMAYRGVDMVSNPNAVGPQGQHVVMVYASPEQAQAEIQRIRGDVQTCSAQAGPGITILRDESAEEFDVFAGHNHLSHESDGEPLLAVRRENVVVRTVFVPSVSKEQFPAYIAAVVDAAIRATPSAA